MTKHILYGLLYIVLLPMAFFLGICVLAMLLIAVKAPVLLLPLFIMACYIIYTIASLIFYFRAIYNEQRCKPVLKDWIRINAFVIILPSVLLFMESIACIVNPQLVAEGIVQLKTTQQMPLTEAGMIKLMKVSFYVLAVYTGVVLLHLQYTFRLLRQYQHAFIEDSPSRSTFTEQE